MLTTVPQIVWFHVCFDNSNLQRGVISTGTFGYSQRIAGRNWPRHVQATADWPLGGLSDTKLTGRVFSPSILSVYTLNCPKLILSVATVMQIGNSIQCVLLYHPSEKSLGRLDNTNCLGTTSPYLSRQPLEVPQHKFQTDIGKTKSKFIQGYVFVSFED